MEKNTLKYLMYFTHSVTQSVRHLGVQEFFFYFDLKSNNIYFCLENKKDVF